PDSFLWAAALSHDAVASDAHFVMKLLSAAPASFFSSALCLQVCLAMAPVTLRLKIKSARASCFISSSRVRDEAISPRREALRAFCPSLWMACYCGASPHLLTLVGFLGHHLALLIAKNYADCAKRRLRSAGLCRQIRVTGR